MDATLEDYRTAPLPPKERALIAFVDRMNADTTSVGPDDIAAAKAAGWTDEALYDAITVGALFRFYNAWIDATGVHDMPAAAYEAGAQRMAQNGYVAPQS